MSNTPGDAEYFRSFANLTFDDFRERAKNQSLSANEKIGFPRQYRDEYTRIIYSEICSKLPAMSQKNSVIFDIGCGCGDLVELIVEGCNNLEQSLVLFDSPEMLGQLSIENGNRIRKVPGFFPNESCDVIQQFEGAVDAILVYSVIQYIFGHSCVFAFLDACLSLLSPGGRCLIGDIPNQSMRNRFFSSGAGLRAHQEFTQSSERPQVDPYKAAVGGIDDSVIMSLALRARNAGFHSFILPQDARLPAANRREDLLIVRP